MWKSCWIAAALALVTSAAAAQISGPSCSALTGWFGEAAYRQCAAYAAQARSPDPYVAAMGRAGLLLLQQRSFDREQRGPDFSIYGVPAPAPATPARRGCIIMGDGLGGGIADCD